MLRQLHQLRARMVDERREDQDIAAARADELLARARQLRRGRPVSAADATRVQESAAPPRVLPARRRAGQDARRRAGHLGREDAGRGAALDAYVRDAEADDARCLREIRGVLDRFDWEHDDRQYALETIERIADGGQQ